MWTLLLELLVLWLLRDVSSTPPDTSCDTRCHENGTRTCQEGICTCKDNVIGANCFACRHGTVDLDGRNEKGCSECHCSGHSPSCQLRTWTVSNLTESFEATRGKGWTITGEDFNRTSSKFQRSFDGSSQYLYLRSSYSLVGTSNFYWRLPARLKGDWVSSYGGNMYYTIHLACGSDFSCSFNQDPWVVLVGGLTFAPLNIQYYLFGTKGQRWRGMKDIKIPLHEGYGKRDCWRDEALKCVSRKDMLVVLSNVIEVYIKAGLFRASLNRAIGKFSREVSAHKGTEVTRVEVCRCPAPYTGTSCHLCEKGLWHRSGWTCEPCNCNGYSYDCNSFTGRCTNCAYDTACDSCNCCADGFYGLPGKNGEANPCKPCPCDNKADKCSTNPDGSFGHCVDCVEGYTGQYCNVCSDGFYGNPDKGIPCRRCICNGNIDASVTGNCNNVTGECYKCIYNTDGFDCGTCKRGYHGDALHRKCKVCKCNMVGSKDNICNTTTGQCTCRDNVAGLSCDTCTPQTYGFSSGNGCKPCNCDTSGTKSGLNECDAKTGQCNCKADRQFARCNGCIAGYYLVSGRCYTCECPYERSVNSSCNGVTGACYCKPGLTGAECDIAACTPTPWSDWTVCSKPCGNGTQTRTRRLLLPSTHLVQQDYKPENCKSFETVTRPCNTAACSPSASLSECTLRRRLKPLTFGNCRTRRHVSWNMCQGRCGHEDITCCQPYLLTQKQFTLHCTDGRRIKKKFDVVTQCGCLTC